VAANSRDVDAEIPQADLTAPLPLPDGAALHIGDPTSDQVPTNDETEVTSDVESDGDGVTNRRSPIGAGLRTLRSRYVLEALIGQGGVGSVYRALDLNRVGLPREHQYVALKIIDHDAARRAGAPQSLRREFHQAQSLSHPGIVNVFDFDHEDDTYFVTMELLDGDSLGALMRRLSPERLHLETARRVLLELGEAVAYAHDRGVLHLDLKPDNVMIDAAGHVRVLDFGLARSPLAEPSTSGEHASPAAATPAYASCERLVQEKPDVRDDVFSFSCIAYELLAGKHPFDRLSALRARNENRTPRRIGSLSRRQWHTLRKGLAWAREDRLASVRQLLDELGLKSPELTVAHAPQWRHAATASVLALLGAGLLAGQWMERRLRESVDVRAPTAVREPTTALPSPSELTAGTDSNALATEEPPQPVRVARPAARPATALSPPVVSLDVLGFSQHSFPVSEANSVASLTVLRTGDAANDVSFQWHTVDDSATAALDYVFGYGEEHMAPGQMTATLVVPIVGDTAPENPELLRVVLENARGARIGPAGRVPIIIVDDD
jgi:serine/threonine protein kinase